MLSVSLAALGDSSNTPRAVDIADAFLRSEAPQWDSTIDDAALDDYGLPADDAPIPDYQPPRRKEGERPDYSSWVGDYGPVNAKGEKPTPPADGEEAARDLAALPRNAPPPTGPPGRPLARPGWLARLAVRPSRPGWPARPARTLGVAVGSHSANATSAAAGGSEVDSVVSDRATLAASWTPVSRKPLQLLFNMTLYESMRAMFVSRSRELVQR